MNKFLKSALCAAFAMMSVQSGLACTNVLITKGASKDGSVLVTYAADSHQNCILPLRASSSRVSCSM